MLKIRTLLLAGAVTGTMTVAGAADPTDADNTAKNERDKSGETLTSGDQSNDPADIKITADTRKAVVADESLSMTAKNCKIITIGGAITLRGPVDSAAEKTTIAAHATKAGATKITNDLEVKADSAN